MNNRYCGKLADYKPISEDSSRVIIMYEMEEKGDMVEWWQVVFYKKQGYPTFEQIRQAILADINEQVKAKIVGGLVWNGVHVWLSEENQLNWRVEGHTLPVTFKVGEEAEGDPIYHTFENVEELQAFNAACVGHIQSCLAEGWARKDAINWDDYKI